jgi:hypothetical protein
MTSLLTRRVDALEDYLIGDARLPLAFVRVISDEGEPEATVARRVSDAVEARARERGVPLDRVAVSHRVIVSSRHE